MFKFPGAGRFTLLKLVIERTVACPEFLHGTYLPHALQSPICMTGVKQNWMAPLDIANLANFCILPLLDYI